MLMPVAITAAVLIAGLLAFVATRPTEFRIARSRTIAAPPEVAQAFVNDLHNWPAWNPWQKLDPTMTPKLSGAKAGPGAVYEWTGNGKVGAGRMTITDSLPAKSVTMRLEFFRPFKATNTVQYDFVTRGSGTLVTWAMVGRNNFVMKAFCLLMNMDRAVGKDFEQGLVNLDAALVENGALVS